MISYYHNPKTEDLIIWDPEEKEIFIIEKIRNVRVETGGDIKMGDDGERNIPILKRKKKSWKISDEDITTIKKMRSEMKSGREIANAIGKSEGTVWKYLKK